MVCEICGKTLDAVDLYEILSIGEYFDRCVTCQDKHIAGNHQKAADDVPGKLRDTAL